VKRIVVILLGALITAVPLHAQKPDSPHWMVGPDGEPNPEACATCHDEDLSLLQPKLDTCVMCHTAQPHTGASRHLAADAAAVARLLTGEKKDSLPLTDEGRIYCGTCHLFHDPRVNGEPFLEQAWLPRSNGLPQAIRERLESQWSALAEGHGEEGPGAVFFKEGTKALRLPIDDGTLCRHCHGDRQ